MERGGRSRATVPALRLGALVPLTSGQEEERYWYDPGDRAAGRLGMWAGHVYGFDRLDWDEDGVDVAWSWVDLRAGH